MIVEVRIMFWPDDACDACSATPTTCHPAADHPGMGGLSALYQRVLGVSKWKRTADRLPISNPTEARRTRTTSTRMQHEPRTRYFRGVTFPTLFDLVLPIRLGTLTPLAIRTGSGTMTALHDFSVKG